MLLSLLFSFGIVIRRTYDKSTGKFCEELRNVICYINRHSFLKWYYLVQALFTSVFMILPIFLAPYAKDILHASARQYAILEVGLSLGMILGFILLPWVIHKIQEMYVILSCTIISIIFIYIISS